MIKTNAMRILDSAAISYSVKEYDVDPEDLSGVHVASKLGLDVQNVFKTLVARSDKNEIVVLCIPVHLELDLKKCAVVSGSKRLELVAVKELLSITGYIRGGCSPVGMKKKYRTFLHESVLGLAHIYVSAGQRGVQICIEPRDLMRITDAQTGNLCR